MRGGGEGGGWGGERDILFLPLMSVRLSVFPSVTQSCPLYNLKTVQDIFTKLHKKYKASSDDVQNTRTVTLVHTVLELFPFEIRQW